MANPLMSMMGGGSAPATSGMNMGAIQQLKQTMNMLKAVKNPQQALVQAAQQNPQLNAVMQMCQGKNPKDVFYAECQKRGVNPEDILSQLR